MLKMFGNNIKMTRGDTVRLFLDLYNSEGESYEPDGKDQVIFAMEKEGNAILQKEAKGKEVVLKPKDTKDLECGVYDYGIKIIFTNGDINTVIISTLAIMEDI